MHEENAGPVKRRPGRPKRGSSFRKVSVMVPPALYEWAMEQPEGFSELVRRLLTAEHQRRKLLVVP